MSLTNVSVVQAAAFSAPRARRARRRERLVAAAAAAAAAAGVADVDAERAAVGLDAVERRDRGLGLVGGRVPTVKIVSIDPGVAMCFKRTA